MRVVVPERIARLADVQAPYIKYVEGIGVVLSEDAPSFVVAARKEYLEWWEKQDRK